MTVDRKYSVFKEDDWREYLTQLMATWKENNPSKDNFQFPSPPYLDGCVVLRYQDIFTASALYEYAGLVTTTVEVMKLSGGAGWSDQIIALEELSRIFMALGDEATEWNKRKIPD